MIAERRELKAESEVQQVHGWLEAREFALRDWHVALHALRSALRTLHSALCALPSALCCLRLTP